MFFDLADPEVKQCLVFLGIVVCVWLYSLRSERE